MGLFRDEAIEHQSRRLHGSISLYQPVALKAFAMIAVVLSALLLIFLVLVKISRKETVPGWLVPEGGIAEVYSSRTGVISQIYVDAGQKVTAGQVLGAASVDINGQNGGLAARGRIDATDRLNEVNAQISQRESRYAADLKQVDEKIRSISQQIEVARRQRTNFLQQVNLANSEIDALKPVVERGFVSKMEMNKRVQTALSLEQNLESVSREIVSLEEAMSEAKSARAMVPIQTAVETSQLRSSASSIKQNLTELDVQESNVFKSPVDGIVAYVTAFRGQNVNPSLPLFAIAPRSAALEAVILVPARSIGFVKVGQAVKLMVDSYPYQHYGTLAGTVSQISKTSLNPNQISAPIEIKEAFYRVKVRSQTPMGLTFGRRLVIQSGMTIQADIVVDKRSLVDWLFEPIIAAGYRAAN